jgi:predicted ribosome quality control (RQC) complex YloA/Tae2 family protein
MSYKTEVKFVQGLNEEITFHIGKSPSGNFEIIDNADEDDLWFHVDNESSCHVVASIPENMDRKDIRYIMKQGAVLCKQNSKFKKSKTKTNIIYTKIKNVEKTDIPGKVEVSDGKNIRI